MDASIVVRLIDETKSGFSDINRNLQNLDSSTGSVAQGFKILGAAALAAFSVQTLKATYDLTDSIQTLDNKLKLVTNSADDLNKTYSQLLAVANNSRSSLDATANLYSKLALNQEAAGLKGMDLMKVVEAFNKTLIISGASATEAASSTYQFAQAMQSGKLQGDEFRAMAEANPRILKLLSEQTGIATTQLKSLASDGFLSAKIIALALQQGLSDLDGEFGKTSKTVGQATTELTNNFQALFREFMNGSGFGETFVKVIEFINKNLDNLVAIAKIAGLVLAGFAIYLAPVAAAFLAAGAAIVYFSDYLGPLAKMLLNLGGAVIDTVTKSLGQMGAAIKAVINFENPFEAWSESGKKFDEALDKNKKSLDATGKEVDKLGQTTNGLTGETKKATAVTDEMKKAMQENGLAAKMTETAFSKYLDGVKEQIKYGGLFSDNRRDMIEIDKVLQKTVDEGRKIGKQYTDSQLDNMRNEAKASIARRDEIIKNTQELEDRYKGYISYIKSNQDKSLTDTQKYEKDFAQATKDRITISRFTEEEYFKYIDALRANYSKKYTDLIQQQNLANLTNTQKYQQEITQLEADIAANRISKDVDTAAVRTAIAKKYNEEYVALAKKGNEDILTDTQNYLNKVAEIENAAKIGIITSEEQKQAAILGARRTYGQKWDELAKSSRDNNMTAEQEYLRKMQEFNAASSAGLIKNKEDEAAILKKIRDDYTKSTISEYSTMYDMLGTKLQDMLGISKEKWGLMTEVSKLFGIDTKAILKDMFAQGIMYLTGFTNPGGQQITTLGGLIGSVFGGGGPAQKGVGDFGTAATKSIFDFGMEGQSILGGFGTWIGGLFSGVGSTILDVFSGLGGGITSIFSGIGSFLSDNVLGVLGDIVSSAASAVSSLFSVSSASSGVGGGGSIGSSIVSAGLSYITGGLSDVFDFFFAKGGAFSGGNIVKKYANGGVVSRPTLFPMANGMGLMGEAGPEAVMPLSRGSDGSLGVAASGGGSAPVNISFTVNAMDAKDFDTLLIEKQQLISNIVSNAVRQGRSFA
jgi:tape measure domain-containing protein